MKSFSSQLSFHIENREQFEAALAETHEQIGEMSDSFDQVLTRVQLPPEVEGIGGNHCIAEGIIAGTQGAPEGYDNGCSPWWPCACRMYCRMAAPFASPMACLTSLIAMAMKTRNLWSQARSTMSRHSSTASPSASSRTPATAFHLYFLLVATGTGGYRYRPGRSTLLLPCRPLTTPDKAHLLGEPEGAPPLPIELIEPSRHVWQVVRDLAPDTATLEVTNDQGCFRIPEIDLEARRSTEERYSYQADNFSSLRGETSTVRGFRRGDWETHVETYTILSCDPQSFITHSRLDAYEGER